MKIAKTFVTLALCMAVLLCGCLSAMAISLDTAGAAEEQASAAAAQLTDGTLVPGVNVFTGTTAAKNFSADDLSRLNLHGTTSAQIWDGSKLWLEPAGGASPFYTRIYLPDGVRVDRPALTITDLHSSFSMVKMNGVYIVGGGDTFTPDGVAFTNLKADSGETTAYYEEDTICLTMESTNGGTFNIFSNMAVIPYYKITYKNILPDGNAGGADIVKYYLGSAEQKAAMTASTGTVTGLPTSYPVDTAVTLTTDGYVLTGWALTAGGAAVDNAALANADIELYPVWEEGEVPEPELVPGVNAFTGTTAVKNFTAADLAAIVTTQGSTEIWTNNSLRIYPPSAGATFSSSIKLPLTIDRPALTVTDLWLMSTQLMIDSGWWGTGWEEQKMLYAQKVDTGAETSYGKDRIGITIADLGGTNVNILSNMAVIPYYQITYKNLLPNGSVGGEDIIKYYLGTAEEKAAISNASSGITGLPTNYPIDTAVTLTTDGYVLTGWALTAGGTAVDNAALANADIELYPVWEEGEVPEPELVPGVNAFTGTTAVKNFTASDLSSIVTTEGSAEIWTNNSLRLYPPTPGVYFNSSIRLPLTIDRPALTLTNLWLMSTQIVVNGEFREGPWESDVTYNNVHIDTGADTAYGNGNKVGITISDMSGTNINILSNMAVIPYYQITYKNILPNGNVAGDDVIKYYLGTAEEKAAITNASSGITGLPTSYPVEDVALDANGHVLLGWSLTEGGAVVDTVPLANADIVLYPVWGGYDPEVVTPETKSSVSMRISPPMGMRFQGSVSSVLRTIDATEAAVEYGFIVTREDLLGANALTFDCGVNFVYGKAYSRADVIDKIAGLEGENFLFNGVVIGIPDTKAAYTQNFVVRSYVKIGDSYYYGAARTCSLYEAVKALDAGIVASYPYLQNVIDTVEA